MKIAFVVTSSGISGGHNIILEHAFSLQKRGHEVEILVRCVDQFKFAYLWHDRACDLDFRTISEVSNKSNYDIAIATNFHSVFHLPQVSANFYSLFMQAKESEFVENEEPYLQSWLSSVLDFGLPTIVSASWIREHLLQYFDQEAFLCLSGIRKDLFNTREAIKKGYPREGLRVLVEGPLNVPHKKVQSALNLCISSMATEVWLLTSSFNVENVSPKVRVFSSISMTDLGKIYQDCDVLVKLSTSEGMFGPPLEMFHCGGTVISYEVPGYEEYMVNGLNSMVIPMGEEGRVLEAINLLSENSLLLDKLKNGAKDTAEKWPDWNVASERFEQGLIWACNNSKLSRNDLSRAVKSCTQKYLREKWLNRKRRLMLQAT